MPQDSFDNDFLITLDKADDFHLTTTLAALQRIERVVYEQLLHPATALKTRMKLSPRTFRMVSAE